MKAQEKSQSRMRRKSRIRAVISGTEKTPRASVFKSNTALYVQLIDDEKRVTLVSATTLTMKGAKPNKDGATKLGKEVAQLAKDKGIATVVFDRNGYRYHGNVKVLADAMREGGLSF